MEKMRCSSCGGEIIIDNDNEYGTCPYCNTKYKLNNNINFNIKFDDNTKEVLNNSTKYFSKFLMLPIIVFIAIFIIIVVCILKFSSSQNSISKSTFNNQFFGANGTQNTLFLKSTLDNIIESNKVHKRKVILEFEDKELTDEKEILEIKHSLSGNYEVSFNYDTKGYINKIIIEKVK